MQETVQGMQSLLNKLGKIESLVTQKRIVARALRAGAEPIRQRAEELAPEDPATPGARLKDFMTTRVLEQNVTSAVAYIGPKPWAFIGAFAEFGTIHQAARPFMRPAYDEKRGEAVAVIAETLASEIAEEAHS